MLKKLTISLAAGALALSAPIAAQDDDAEKEEVLGLLEGMFADAEPLTAEQQARMSAAERVVGQIFPVGTYAKMMGDTVSPMMNGLISEVVDEPSGELARLTGLSYEDLEEADEGTIRDAMAIMDPAFQVRTERTANATIKLLTDVMNSIEPSYRAGLSRAYAVRFTEAELEELGAFFSTPTGAHYAAESMLIYTDPQVMSAMSEMMPAMFDMMPEMTSAMEEASSGLQAPRKYSELNKSEQARISRILGVSRKELLESEPAEYAEDEDEMAEDAAEEAADVTEEAADVMEDATEM